MLPLQSAYEMLTWQASLPNVSSAVQQGSRKSRVGGFESHRWRPKLDIHPMSYIYQYMANLHIGHDGLDNIVLDYVSLRIK